MAHRPLHVCLLTRSLDAGGAERQLAELARHLDKRRFEVTVLTFYPGGLLRREVEQAPGVRLVSLDKTGRWDAARFGARLIGTLRRLRPDVVHGYLDVANLLAWLGGRAAGAKVVWGVRGSDRNLDWYDWSFRAAVRTGAALSRHVDLVIFNSHAGLRHHVDHHGFCRRNTAVVPNGIDTGRFRPRPEARQRVRRAWGVTESEFLFGLVGRLDPMKGHRAFLDAMARLARRRPRIRAVCIGDGPAETARRLAASAAARALGGRLRWESARPDVECAFAALDGLVMSSVNGEGFPNVVGEAMAAGVPSVVTAVGDAALLLADPQRTVPPGDPERLARACERLLDRPPAERARIGVADRRRIVDHFSAQRLAERTGDLLRRVASCA